MPAVKHSVSWHDAIRIKGSVCRAIGVLQSGPALAGAGPNGRPRCGAPLSRGFMTSSCSVNRAMQPSLSADTKLTTRAEHIS